MGKLTSRLLLAVIFTVPLAAHAGGKASFVAGDRAHQTVMTMIWRDTDNLRMQVGNQADYFLVHHGKAYSVSNAGGKPRVMDMQGMMRMMRSMGMGGHGAQAKAPNHFGRVGSVKATGKTETVAGIKGRVYQIRWTDPDGTRKSEQAVLTDNPLAVEMTRAYFSSISAMYGSREGLAFQKGLPGRDRGVLRVGKTFRVKSMARSNPPSSTFELPAKPMSLQDMMGGMGGH